MFRFAHPDFFILVLLASRTGCILCVCNRLEEEGNKEIW